ncbi:putative GTP diphosphokinase CRSH1, chloroplastic [Nannochloris sp. 'desiccata']|nr:putative GTP diphosphokinase CRSH1, chloroplastic [Chlorella desiccata (nom. nud.)]
MADLPGLSGLRNPIGNRAHPASCLPSLANRKQITSKHVPGVKISGGLGAFSGKSSAGPSSLRGNEWRRRRALAEHTAEDLASLNLDTASSGTQSLASMDIPSTSGRGVDTSKPQFLGSSGSQPMLQLVAAWNSLASRLPPQTGAGPDADLLVNTLKLVLAHANQTAASRALSLASCLAEMAGDGIPLDARAIAAGILAEAFPQGFPTGMNILEQRVGRTVMSLLADLKKVRRLPSRIELYDDAAAAALRELCIAFYDVRSTAVEVVARLHTLQLGAAELSATRKSPDNDGECNTSMNDADLQVSALEALQIYAPLGHALGMGSIASRLEDLCFQVLFPASYEATTVWLHQQSDANAVTLDEAQATLHAAVATMPEFHQLASGIKIYGRTKSPFSTLKKLLRLGDTIKGGRSRSEVYDLIGLRAVVIPRSDLSSSEEAEEAAIKACYLVEQAAHTLWSPVEGRSKDYIQLPKPNGYQSLHSTVAMEGTEVKRVEVEAVGVGVVDSTSSSTSSIDRDICTLELQIRTEAMHSQAESGQAAHAAYKGGLDASQAKQLREWTESMLSRNNGTAVAGSSSDLSDSDDCTTTCSSTSSTGTAEALFRSLDINGDGKVSLDELRYVVTELGGGRNKSGSGDDAGAAALLAALDTNSDGEVSLDEFLDFQTRVGLVHAASAMDEATAAAAEELLLKRTSSSTTSAIAATGKYSIVSAGKLRRLDTTTTPASFSPSSSPTTVINNGSSSSSLQSWNSSRSGGSGSSDSGDISPRSMKARRQAAAFFIEQEEDFCEADAIDTSAHGNSTNGINSLQKGDSRSTSNDNGSVSNRLNGTHGSGRWSINGSLDEANTDPNGLPSSTEEGGEEEEVIGRIGPSESPIPLPRHGPCIIGAVRNKDCDVIINVPTISGRHARLEIIRQHTIGLSKCVIMDLGSMNGTWVNRAKITPFKEVPLYPGDVVCMAEPSIAFEVAVVTTNTNNATVSGTGIGNSATEDTSSSAVNEVTSGRVGSSDAPSPNSSSSSVAPVWGPAVSAALRAAAALEAEAASRGVFAPLEALCSVNVGGKARSLLAAGDYQAAYMLLLGSVMAAPGDATLWAQLAGMERQRARRQEQGSSYGTTRAFLRAAAERFESLPDPASRRAGLSRVFSSWAQLEYDMRNDGPARILFQKAVRISRSHPAGAGASGTAKHLFTWASREWKLGDAPLAARLCKEALEIEPVNPYALTLLGNIEASAGQIKVARDYFKKAVDTGDRNFVSGLQSWARMEAQDGNIKIARTLFRRALKVQPENAFVLQAWGVAEGRSGKIEAARALFNKCIQVDPKCRAAWHAWGKLEEEAEDLEKARELYKKALGLKAKSVETLSALGRLERTAGNFDLAMKYLETALEADAKHAPSLQEMALLLRTQGGADADAYRLEKRAKFVNSDRRAMLTQVKRPGYGAAAAKKAVAATLSLPPSKSTPRPPQN